MKILHLLSAGTIGGIEILCRDIAKNNNEKNIFAFLFRGGPVEEQIVETGAHVYQVYRTNRWNMIRFVNQLGKICEEEKVDIVIVHHEGLSIWLYYLLLMKKKKDIKYIRYVHSVFEEKYYYTNNLFINICKKKLLQLVITKSDKLIAVSECVKKSIENYFQVDLQKIDVVYNGISEEQIRHNMRQNRIHHKGIHLIYIGRLVKVKGIDVLIEAFAEVEKERKDISLFIIGDGEERETLEAQVKRRGLSGKINFEGFQMDKDNYLLQSDIFVYPSKWQEAFGISIIEAMSYGLICIAANTGGIPEIIEDGKNGFLYENADCLQLAIQIRRAVQMIEKKQETEFSVQAIKTAKKFTIERTIQNLDSIYRSLH